MDDIRIMDELIENLKRYFRETSQEEIERDWKEMKYLNEIGPDVFEYAEFVRKNFEALFNSDIDVLTSHKFTSTNIPIKDMTEESAQYYLAA